MDSLGERAACFLCADHLTCIVPLSVSPSRRVSSYAGTPRGKKLWEGMWRIGVGENKSREKPGRQPEERPVVFWFSRRTWSRSSLCSALGKCSTKRINYHRHVLAGRTNKPLQTRSLEQRQQSVKHGSSWSGFWNCLRKKRQFLCLGLGSCERKLVWAGHWGTFLPHSLVLSKSTRVRDWTVRCWIWISWDFYPAVGCCAVMYLVGSLSDQIRPLFVGI